MLQNSKAFSSYSVDDIKKAKDFYQNLLGLDVKEDPMGYMEIHFSSGNTILLYPKPDHAPASFTVLNFPVADIDKTVDALTEKGLVFLQYEHPIKTDRKGISRDNEGPKIAWFKDPAGNILSILEI
ncbi:VOC family protein [Aequorivita sp. SDUM287046]|uniref:VOC family protein n=1 Tax=Aequorivita aurantiaca TaxID=3053356 RepID=A0ABT8DK05_9FLAO|nr:VOC family protein [Aequorivita aurantiaca]MDN3724240.1 VOC family protein [Aequorivita aurantiaca]